MSTIGEEATGKCLGLAHRYGVGFVDAPVLGTREPAEPGELVVLESGSAQDRTGIRLKLVTNSWVLAVVEAGAETIALAEGLGVDPSLFFQAVEGGALDPTRTSAPPT